MANINIVKGEIGNALTSVAPNHILGVANDIFDENQQRYQQDINTELLGRSEGVYDISAEHLTEGNPTQYASLADALGTNGANIPANKRKGGMSVKFIQSNDHKYVQYRLVKNTWSINTNYWERDNDVITSNQSNSDLDFSDEQGNVLTRFSNGHIKTKNFDSSKDASEEERGLMSAEDKTKLNTIEEGAEVNDVITDDADDVDLDLSDEQGHVVMRIANGHIKTKNFDSENIQPTSVSKPKISYLAIGNSVNQDVVAYIPYLLKKLYGDSIDFEIGIAFIASYTIKDYVEQVITNQKKIETYSYANNTDKWTNSNNTYYLEDILGLHQWNMISFQMYQTQTTGSAHTEDVTLAPQLLNYIKSNAIQECSFGFVTPATYTDMRDTYIEWQQIVLTNCALDFFIDYGATKELMIREGISTSLMCTDGYHSNEGFPCISLSLTAIHVLSKLINIKDESSNLKDRMTAAKHSTLNIPGQHGSFTTTTENNWRIGIDSAINGFRVSNATLNISNSTLRQQTYNNN